MQISSNNDIVTSNTGETNSLQQSNQPSPIASQQSASSSTMSSARSIDNDTNRGAKQTEPPRNSACRINLAGMHRIEHIAATEQLLPEAIQTQMELLDKYYDRIARNINEMEFAGATSFAEASANEVMMLEADVLYATLKTQLRAKLSAFNQTNTASTSHNTSAREDNSVEMRKLNIERFNGDFSKWPKFKELFEEFVHNNHQIADITKFMRLDALISADSEPSQTISGFTRIGSSCVKHMTTIESWSKS